ncbi:hypothetical protein M0805_008457 [Coniferiporia weirii]|nr:hypothetical protein M0805_008457 [Coniferiporia weirii]
MMTMMAAPNVSSALKAARALTRSTPFLLQNSKQTAQSQTQTQTTAMASVSTLSPTAAGSIQQQQQQQQQTQSALGVSSGSSTMSALQAPLPITRSLSIKLRKPIPNSYWATPFLVACEYPWAPSTSRPKLDALLAAGVRTFIDLTESGELLSYQQLLPLRAQSCGLSPAETHTLEYFRFPIPDRQCPSSPELLARILSVLRACERRSRVAAVHCRGGIGRTGTVVGCWLVESGRARDGAEALGMIAKEWKTVEKCGRFPCSPETGPQFEFVRNFRGVPRSPATSGLGVGVNVNVNMNVPPAGEDGEVRW